MAVVLGPILGFRGATATTWNVSALWVTTGSAAPKLVVSGASSQVKPAVHLAAADAGTAWRVDVAVARDPTRSLRVRYGLAGEVARSFLVPKRSEPLQIGFASCNGFGEPKHKKKIEDRDARWRHLVGKHASDPMHLLILGGDQVYGDAIWRKDDLDFLAGWLDLPTKQRKKRKLSAGEKKAVANFYFGLYCKRWGRPAVAEALASIPSLMMWDDHDVFDGWGSHDPDLQGTDVFAAIFAEATRAFRTFQLQIAPGEQRPGAIVGGALSYAHAVDDVAIVMIDLRSERTPRQTLGENAWNAVLAEVDRLARAKPKHLFVVSGPPVVFPSTSSFERIVDFIPGEQSVEDDLRDRWGSKPHLATRARVVDALLAAARENAVRVTLLSGDVHLAALGVIESTHDPAPTHANVINNFVSSPIVHSPPSRLALLALKLLDKDVEIGRGVTARMHKIPGADAHYLAQRNWMRLRSGANHVVTAEWWVEDADPARDVSYAKVVNPVA